MIEFLVYLWMEVVLCPKDKGIFESRILRVKRALVNPPGPWAALVWISSLWEESWIDFPMGTPGDGKPWAVPFQATRALWPRQWGCTLIFGNEMMALPSLGKLWSRCSWISLDCDVSGEGCLSYSRCAKHIVGAQYTLPEGWVTVKEWGWFRAGIGWVVTDYSGISPTWGDGPPQHPKGCDSWDQHPSKGRRPLVFEGHLNDMETQFLEWTTKGQENKVSSWLGPAQGQACMTVIGLTVGKVEHRPFWSLISMWPK